MFVDQNAARNPDSPLEPLFRALNFQNADFNIGEIDLVSDRNNIRKLLRFVQASSSDAFEIQVEVAGGKTVLFTRVEPETTEAIRGFRGYGYNFKKAYTECQAGNTGYYRVIRYRFGGMNLVVRYDTEGFIEKKGKAASLGDAQNVDDALAGSMKALDISRAGDTNANASALVVRPGGRPVDLSLTLEIKTRAAGRLLDMAEVTSQLWIGQTPNLAIGYHRKGIFDDIRVRDMEDDIYRWEVANREVLSSLASLVRKIVALVKDSGHRNAILKYNGHEKLSIIRTEQERMLPKDLYSKWEGNVNATVQDGSDNIPEPKATLSSSHVAERENQDINTDATRAQQSSSKDKASPTVPDNLPFSELIKVGVSRGFRQFFRRMPTQLSEYHLLCEDLALSYIDVLGGRNMRDIMSDMRRGKSDWDPDERRNIGGLKGPARDSAFRLLYMFSLRKFEQITSDQNMGYNATLFVVSHSGIFKCRTRKMVREAFDDRYRFRVSQKQRATLDKWSIKELSQELQEEDVTTEEEDYDFDSDWSY